VSTQTALKLLFELRAVLDRLGENDSTMREALAQDIERAVRLTNSCIGQLTQEPSTGRAETEEEEDE
jgi:5'-3' exonuclease